MAFSFTPDFFIDTSLMCTRHLLPTRARERNHSGIKFWQFCSLVKKLWDLKKKTNYFYTLLRLNGKCGKE